MDKRKDEITLTEQQYMSLDFYDYADIFGFPKPRFMSVFRHFSIQYRQHIRVVEKAGKAEKTKKLEEVWKSLPFYGKLDY